jgi:ATP-dependent RNA helicase HrpB
VNPAAGPPALSLVEQVHAAFASHHDCILQAAPGAGKSTVLPLALLSEPWAADRKLLMLEPRRLAARAIARRMAQTLGEEVGATVGYRMRLDTRVSAATRIEVITEGVLGRLLQADPALEEVACVIFDEYHERSLNADVGLALCLNARRELDARFRLLVMSATLEAERLSRFLERAACLSVPGRAFAVQTHYLGRGAPLLPGGAESPERLIVPAIERALRESAGHVLVFLPGAGEIRRVQSNLGQQPWAAGLRVLPLYGDLSAAEQDQVLAADDGRVRKIVLSTNIAETSLTIPGISAVVDSGLVRRSRFDPNSGMSRLEVMRISRASADQRAGRAGRTAPGVCYRLWSEGAQDSLAAQTPPEISEADLADLALELADWGVADAAQLDWLDPPPAAMLAQARALLRRLGALDAADRITAAGREMARLPTHPRLAHMLLAARGAGALGLAAELAALLSERDLLRRTGRDHDPDLRTRLEILRRESHASTVDRGARQRVQRTAEQLARLAGDRHAVGARGSGAGPGVLLAQAFPDRIGQRREGDGGRFLLSNGRGAVFSGAQALARAEFIVAVELDDREREARIDLACPLTREELLETMAAQLQESRTVSWDPRTESVTARQRLEFEALILEDRPLQQVPAEITVAAMLEGVRQMGLACLPWDAGASNYRARLEFVRRLGRANLKDWPASDDAALLEQLDAWLPMWLHGMTRREHLSRLPLQQALRERLKPAQRRELEQLAPAELIVPSGSHITIDYQDESAPSVSVRLQEVFGLATTPRIGGGAVPMTFKLLSPARRPLQVTRDLAGFWSGSYALVRKEMRGRYPKHNWPENPLEAAPSRGLKRR